MQSHRVIQPHVFEPPALKAAAARRPPLKMPGSWWLWLILLALLLPGIYFISSVWVRIQIEPPADEYSVSGLGSLVLADGFLALPGRSYQVKASKKGYQPLQTLYTASPADSQLFSARLEPLAGIIAIQSSPPGAEISLDAKPLGVSPLTKTDIPQGRYQLQASLPL
ncbi:MAG: PEGA domain-containing protein, partial [gamma proteobacterium symbiont of Bathyaustriella thionipta]|nr:PEGA domain-containing protein [gamma proteobacterium symbiont of Bathyaustriella thionipta]